MNALETQWIPALPIIRVPFQKVFCSLFVMLIHPFLEPVFHSSLRVEGHFLTASMRILCRIRLIFQHTS
jgi:hypothetical protein